MRLNKVSREINIKPIFTPKHHSTVVIVVVMESSSNTLDIFFIDARQVLMNVQNKTQINTIKKEHLGAYSGHVSLKKHDRSFPADKPESRLTGINSHVGNPDCLSPSFSRLHD